MPTLTLFVTSSPLFSAALGAASPLPASPPILPTPLPTAAQAVTPDVWSLTAVQDTAPPTDDPDSLPQDQTAQDDPADVADQDDGVDQNDGADEGNTIVVEGAYGPPASDPGEQFNAASYRVTQALDETLVGPLAYAYRDGLPGPIRDGLGNVVRNLGEPSNALNYLLQGKIGKAFETLGRLAINSTIGLGGLIDVAAKPGIGLPYKRNGFANTFGYYGIGAGPYVFLPVTGATSVRDFIGNSLDQALLPFLFNKPFSEPEYAVSYFVINGLEVRLEFDAELAKIAASDDPYGVRRDTYLAQREREIAALKGEVLPEPEPELELEDEAEGADGDTTEAPPPQSGLTLPERVQLTAGATPEER